MLCCTALQVRGLGGTMAVPTCSVGEENVLRLPSDPYREESILVHEFAHTIMEVSEGGQGALRRVWGERKGRGQWFWQQLNSA